MLNNNLEMFNTFFSEKKIVWRELDLFIKWIFSSYLKRATINFAAVRLVMHTNLFLLDKIIVCK